MMGDVAAIIWKEWKELFAGEGREGDFDRALDDFCAEWDRGSETDARFEMEYLLTVGRKQS